MSMAGITTDLIPTAMYIPIIAELVVGAALVVVGILILILGRRRWKAVR